jgi:serine/threonine-protein kinase RsbW
MERNINISSKTENLRLVEKIVDEISEKFYLDSELYGNVLIATIEATNNAIVHGNKSDENKSVFIHFNCLEDKLVITITDEGKGFDYLHIPDPTSPENIENINGRGVFLMEKLSDRLTFYENGSKVELIFKLR